MLARQQLAALRSDPQISRRLHLLESEQRCLQVRRLLRLPDPADGNTAQPFDDAALARAQQHVSALPVESCRALAQHLDALVETYSNTPAAERVQPLITQLQRDEQFRLQWQLQREEGAAHDLGEAQLYLQSGQHERARPLLQRVIRRCPGSPWAARAQMHLHAMEQSEAVTSADSVD